MIISRYQSRMVVESLEYGTPMIDGKYSLLIGLRGVYSEKLDNGISEAELHMLVDEPHTLHLAAAKGRRITVTVEVEHGD